MTKYGLITQSFFSRVVLQHPWIVILCMLAIVGFFFLGARDFRLDASSETLVLESDEDLKYSRSISSRYGQKDFLILAYTPKSDLFSDETLAALAELRDDLVSLENVESVLSILDVPLLESSAISIKELAGNLSTLSSSKVDMELAKKELRESSLYRELLLSSDSQTTALLVNFSGNDVYHDLLEHRNRLREKKDSGSLTKAESIELKQVAKQLRQHRDTIRQQRHNDITEIRNIMDKYRLNADLFLGGVSMIADDMITFIKNDLKVFGTGVLLLLIFTLAIIFRRIRWICIPLLCCVISTVCMIGLLGWLGWEVTVVSSNFISLQLIMTMAIVIHLIVRYRELLVRNPQEDNRQLILNTVLLKAL